MVLVNVIVDCVYVGVIVRNVFLDNYVVFIWVVLVDNFENFV